MADINRLKLSSKEKEEALIHLDNLISVYGKDSYIKIDINRDKIERNYYFLEFKYNKENEKYEKRMEIYLNSIFGDLIRRILAIYINKNMKELTIKNNLTFMFTLEEWKGMINEYSS